MKRKKKKITNKKIMWLLVGVFLILLGATSSLGRYVYNAINNHILESQGFYFNSSILTINHSNHNISNWDGVSTYPITIDVNSRKNEYLATNSDVTYDIEVECSSNAVCTVSKENSTIYQSSHADSYNIYVNPTDNIYPGDTVTVTTKATSTYPYRKTISTTYTIGVEIANFTYNIKDEVGSKYCTLELTNAQTYYEVITAFTGHAVGEHLSIEQYNALTAAEKNNCMSAIVTLSFPSDVILLDMTSSYYINRIANSEEITQINGYNYVEGFQFKMDATSNTKIIFYKIDPNQNYSYDGTGTSIITVESDVAE